MERSSEAGRAPSGRIASRLTRRVISHHLKRVRALSDQEVLDYLRQNSTEFTDFLDKHGHRGLKEFDPFWSRVAEADVGEDFLTVLVARPPADPVRDDCTVERSLQPFERAIQDRIRGSPPLCLPVLRPLPGDRDDRRIRGCLRFVYPRLE